MIKSGSLTVTLNENGRGRRAMSRHKQYLSDQDFHLAGLARNHSHELLRYGQTLNSDLLRQQLNHLKAEMSALASVT